MIKIRCASCAVLFFRNLLLQFPNPPLICIYSNIHTDMYYGICIVTYTCTVHTVTHTFTTCIVSIVTHIHTYTCSHTHALHVHQDWGQLLY